MRVILTFYRNFSIPFILISLAGCLLLWQSGSPKFIINVFWMKVTTDAILCIYFHFFRSGQLYFFYNLGYTVRQLYGYTGLIDFIIWGILTTITWQLL